MAGLSLIAINVGNTRTQVGRFEDGELVASEHRSNEEVATLAELVMSWWPEIKERPQAAILLASVNEPVGDRLRSTLEGQLSVTVYRVGEDVPAPIGQDLDPETLTGIDRLLVAAAAYDAIQQACIIVDAGTAVTVDFVDGEGTFHGGAIAPGARLQLRALHEFTSALPEIDFTRPDADPFGRNTAQAMLHGVHHGICGLVRRLVEIYSERYGAYPLVIATGGDAQTLFGDDELIDRIVPELPLLGIAAAARLALRNDEDADLPQS